MIYARRVPCRLGYTRIRDALRGRTSLDWRQAVATADLPAEISDLIRNTVRRTRLWRSEKIDVARELAAHFQDGLGTGRTPQQLIHSFGDPRLAAQLIRRAKRCGRPLAWHVGRGVGRMMTVLVIAYVAVGLYVLSARPSIKTDYLAIFNARAFAVPEAERAWPLYRNAMNAMAGSGDCPGPPNPVAHNVHWEDAGWSEAEQFVMQHAAAIALLREAGRRAALGLPVWPEDESFAPEDRSFLGRPSAANADSQRRTFPDLKDRLLCETQLPQTELLRRASQLLAIDARRAALAGNARIALADVLAQSGMSRQVQEAPCISCALVAGEILASAYSVVQNVLTDQRELWSDDELRDLAREFVQFDIDWGRAIEGQRNMFYDVVQRIYTDDDDGGGRFVPGGMRTLSRLVPRYQTWKQRDYWWPTGKAGFFALPAADLYIASRAKMTAMYERHLGRVNRTLATPIWEWNLSPHQPSVPSFDDQPWQAYRHYLVSVFAPATERVPHMAEYRRGQRDGVLIGIALERYRREHGNWPASLSELAPHWLPALPVDRITGKPLHLRVLDDRVLVYSEGVDRDDDGGRLPPGHAGNHETPAADFAAPIFWTGDPTTEFANDGDWVIWSTTKGREPSNGHRVESEE
jgi:hypothetical protein